MVIEKVERSCLFKKTGLYFINLFLATMQPDNLSEAVEEKETKI